MLFTNVSLTDVPPTPDIQCVLNKHLLDVFMSEVTPPGEGRATVLSGVSDGSREQSLSKVFCFAGLPFSWSLG